MSQENVEKVRAAFAAHNRGDLDAWLDLYDPEVEFETLLLGAHQGKEAMRSLYEENKANQPGYTVTPVDLIDAGDVLRSLAVCVVRRRLAAERCRMKGS